MVCEAKKPSTNNCENEEYVVSKSSKTEGFRLVKDHQLPNAPLIMDFKEEPNVLNSKMKTFDGAMDIIAKNPYFCVKTYTPDNLKHWLDVMKNVKVIHKKLKIHVPFLQDKVSAEQEQLVHLMVDRIEATGADADKKKSVNIRFCGLGGESGTLSLVIASSNGDILMDFEKDKSDKKMLHKQFVQLVKSMDAAKIQSVSNRFNARGFPVFVDHESITVYTFNITCAKGQPSPQHLRISEGCLITKVPGTYFSPPLEFGDHILMINEDRVESQAHFYQLLQEAADSAENNHTLRVMVERIGLLKQLDRRSPLIPAGTLSEGYNYYIGHLIFFPKASLGVSIKSICKKVFVESTDNGLASIGRRIFYIGDRIVTVNGSRCENTATSKEWIIDTLKKENIVTIVLERPETVAAVNQVRMALAISKAPQENPRMPKDVVAICRKEIQRRMQVGESGEYLVPILKEKHMLITSRVSFSSQSTKMNIGMEPTNPAMLSHATGLFNANDKPKDRKHRRKRKSNDAKSPIVKKQNEEASD